PKAAATAFDFGRVFEEAREGHARGAGRPRWLNFVDIRDAGDPVDRQQMGLPKPGPALKGVLLVLFVIWVVFALALNWGGASDQVFLLFVGNPEAIVQGQLWRLVTPLFMHLPSGGIGHILTA